MSEYIISDKNLVLIADSSLRYVSFPDRMELINPESGETVCELMRVVHCKDCKRMREWTPDELDSYDEAELADGWCMFFRIGTYDDFFCAWGERRDA